MLLPFFLWLIVTLVYAFKFQLNIILPNSYVVTLFALPIILIIFKKFSFSQLGFRVGKPASGLFFMILLPLILFLRFYFMGSRFSLTEFPGALILGSVAEEFFFRGYLQEEFKKPFGTIGTFIITNLLFALVHFVKGYSIVGSLSTGLIGLYFSITKDKQGGNSLFYSMGAHSLYNIVVSTMSRGGLFS